MSASPLSDRKEDVFVGRFKLSLPPGMKRFGEDYEMRLVSLREVGLGEKSRDRWQQEWHTRKQEVAQLREERLTPQALDGQILEETELRPGRLLYMAYHDDDVDLAAVFAAWNLAGNWGLWLERPGDVEKSAEIKSSMASLADGYRTQPPGGSGGPGASNAFHLGRGFVAAPFDTQESASSSFKSTPPGTEIELATETVVEPRTTSLLAKFTEALEASGVVGITRPRARSRSRQVAGLRGEELLIKDKQRHVLYYTWRFAGEPFSAVRPQLTVGMTIGDSDETSASELWEAVLDSVGLAP